MSPSYIPGGFAAPIRVLVLEDNRRTRDALVALLEGTPGFTCVAACETAETALRKMSSARPHVLLVDLELSGMTGAEFLTNCHQRFPKVAPLILTVHDTAEWVFPALAARDYGYVVKGTPPTKLFEAIVEVHEGRSWMSGQVARLVLRFIHHRLRPPSPCERLSEREREVLELLAQGLRYADIACRLGIARRTVNIHINNIYTKLHVHSAAGAVGKLVERGETGYNG